MSNSTRGRSGVSLYQSLACLVAVGAGVWVGAYYQGLTVGDVAYTALDEAQILESLPEDWRPEASECPAGDCADQPTTEQINEDLRVELEGLRSEVAELQKANLNGEAPQTGRGGENPVGREATLAHWTRLTQIAADIAALEQEVRPAINAPTTGHAFDLRRRAFDYGLRAVESLPAESVDPQAVEAGHRLIEWYRSGAEFYEQATSVWDGLAGAEADPAAETALQKAQLQHRKHTELLNAKLAEIRSVLSRKYAVEFPALGV